MNDHSQIITTPWDDLSGVQILKAIEEPLTAADMAAALLEAEQHELEHAHQSMMYLTNTVDDENLHKDALLRIYFNKLNKEYDYYADNYKVDSEEVLANIKAVEKTIEYFSKYNIELTKEELEILKHKMDKYQQALNNTQRKNPVDGKMYDLDYLYKCAMEDTINRVDNLNDTDSRKY